MQFNGFDIFFVSFVFFSVKHEEQFEDADCYYGFHENVTSPRSSKTKLAQSLDKNEENCTYNIAQVCIYCIVSCKAYQGLLFHIQLEYKKVVLSIADCKLNETHRSQQCAIFFPGFQK